MLVYSGDLRTGDCLLMEEMGGMTSITDVPLAIFEVKIKGSVCDFFGVEVLCVMERGGVS